jgi:lipoate-protein ligase A
VTNWHVEHRVGSAADLHGRDLDPGPTGRLVEVLEVRRPALVLGSTQQESAADPAAIVATGTEVVRRRSGGGAVLLLPGRATWVDVTIARTDPLWQEDVAVAFHWLGWAWANAARHFGVDAQVHTGRPAENPWSRRVCFAGLGAGEVIVGHRKLVGISQRRTREGARFQCIVHRSWDPVPLLGLLALEDLERAYAITSLLDVATGLDVETHQVLNALLLSLPA